MQCLAGRVRREAAHHPARPYVFWCAGSSFFGRGDRPFPRHFAAKNDAAVARPSEMGSEMSDLSCGERESDSERVKSLENQVKSLKAELASVKEAARAQASPLRTPKPGRSTSMLELYRPSSDARHGGTPAKLNQLDKFLSSGVLTVDDYASLVCREDSLLKEAPSAHGDVTVESRPPSPIRPRGSDIEI